MKNRPRTLRIDPSSRGGTFTVDEALDLGLFEDAVYFKTESPGIHRIVYNDGSRGRATIVCFGFELTTLGYEEL